LTFIFIFSIQRLHSEGELVAAASKTRLGFGAIHAALGAALALGLPASGARADENLFGFVRGAETLPKGAWELYHWTTARFDKGIGEYSAVDTDTEVEYGVTDSFTASAAIETLSIDTSGIVIDGYLPGAKDFVFHPSGVEASAKYNFLKPAADGIGLSTRFGLEYSWIDPHSGQDKDTVSAEVDLILQRYFLEGQLVLVGNLGLESTYADRHAISNLPPGFDWPTDPEMELEIKIGTGLSYRFVPRWYAGVEVVYETEFETEVGQERWSVFIGPSLHYGSERWWATLAWFPQVSGGGEKYPGQTQDYHLIEKTKHEIRLKLGLNF
jgi:hypothetical protein